MVESLEALTPESLLERAIHSSRSERAEAAAISASTSGEDTTASLGDGISAGATAWMLDEGAAGMDGMVG